LEELGITPDFRHYMTKNDLMNQNADLVRRAARILATKPIYHLSALPLTGRNRMLRITASSKVRPRDRRRRIDRIDVSLSGRPHKSLKARNGILPPTTVTLGESRQVDWLVQAFDYDNNLVAASRRHS
jgi:ABC-type molybdate transport system ATPase subunit